MYIEDPLLSVVAGWVGRSHHDLNCWELVQAAFGLRGMSVPDDYYSTIAQRSEFFKVVFDPQPWDLIPFCVHRLNIVNHVALYIGNGHFIHSIEDSGVVIESLYRDRWTDRIARSRPNAEHPEGRQGFLRLR